MYLEALRRDPRMRGETRLAQIAVTTNRPHARAQERTLHRDRRIHPERLRADPKSARLAKLKTELAERERRLTDRSNSLSSREVATTPTAHRKCAVRRRHRDVASANTPHVKKNVLSLVTFFARAKKVTRSPQASESFGYRRHEDQRQGTGFPLDQLRCCEAPRRNDERESSMFRLTVPNQDNRNIVRTTPVERSQNQMIDALLCR